MKRFPNLLATLLLSCLLSSVTAGGQWNAAPSVTNAGLRGISNAGGGVIWASGTDGVIVRSEDEGFLWQKCSVPPGADKLDFRGIVGWNANHAIVMSIGAGLASRLYETEDGCATWRLLFENPDHEGFWDDLAFRGKTGFVLGDPVAGRFALYRSDDSGRHWRRDDSPQLAAAPGEGVFAASNSSLVARSDAALLFATGGIASPRVLRFSPTHGWSAVNTPIAGGAPSAGIFSIAFRDSSHGIVVGGDYKDPLKNAKTAAWTSDGGATWHAASALPSGFRSAVEWLDKIHAWIAVGPNGSDISRDDGRTWKRFDSGNWNALSLPWAAGPKGNLASLDIASTATPRN